MATDLQFPTSRGLTPPKYQVEMDLLNATMSTFVDPTDELRSRFLIMENWDQQQNDGIIQTPLRYHWYIDPPTALAAENVPYIRGSGYTDEVNVALAYYGNAQAGINATVDITTVDGMVDTIAIASGGSQYKIGEHLYINQTGCTYPCRVIITDADGVTGEIIDLELESFEERTDLVNMTEQGLTSFNGIIRPQYQSEDNPTWWNRVYPNYLAKRQVLLALAQDYTAFAHRGRYVVYDYQSGSWKELTTYIPGASDPTNPYTLLGNDNLLYGLPVRGYPEIVSDTQDADFWNRAKNNYRATKSAGFELVRNGFGYGISIYQGVRNQIPLSGDVESVNGTFTSYYSLAQPLVLNSIMREGALYNYGTGYSDGIDIATGAEVGTFLGTGLTVDITTTYGSISTISIHNGGVDYVVGDLCYVVRGMSHGDCTFYVTSVDGTGKVESIKLKGTVVTDETSLGGGRYNDAVTDNMWLISTEAPSLEELRKIYNVSLDTLPAPTIWKPTYTATLPPYISSINGDDGSHDGATANDEHHPPTPEGTYTYSIAPILDGVNETQPAWSLTGKIETLRDSTSSNTYRMNKSLNWLRIVVNANNDPESSGARFGDYANDLIKDGHPRLTGFAVYREFERNMPDSIVFASGMTDKQSEFSGIGSHPPRRIGVIDVNCTQGVYGNKYNTAFSNGQPTQTTANDRPFIPNPKIITFYDGGAQIVYVKGDYYLKLNSKQWDFEVQQQIQEVRFKDYNAFDALRAGNWVDNNGVIHDSLANIEKRVLQEGWTYLRHASGGAVYSVPTIVGVTGDIRTYSWRWRYNNEGCLTSLPHLYAYIDYAEGNRIICERLPLDNEGLIWSIEDHTRPAPYKVGSHASPYVKLDNDYKTDWTQSLSDLQTFLINYNAWVNIGNSLATGDSYVNASDVTLYYGSDLNTARSWAHVPPNTGYGAGASVDINTSSGEITSVTIHDLGAAYSIGDILWIDCSTTNCSFARIQVTGVNGTGGITAITPTDNVVAIPVEGSQLKARVGIGWTNIQLNVSYGQGYPLGTNEYQTINTTGSGSGATFSAYTWDLGDTYGGVYYGQLDPTSVSIVDPGQLYEVGDLLEIVSSGAETYAIVRVDSIDAGDGHIDSFTFAPYTNLKTMRSIWLPDHAFDLAVEEGVMNPVGEQVTPNYGGSVMLGNQRFVWDIYENGRLWTRRIRYTRVSPHGYPTCLFRGSLDVPGDEEKDPIIALIPLKTVQLNNKIRASVLICGKVKSRVMYIDEDSDTPVLGKEEYLFGLAGEHAYTVCEQVAYGVDHRGMMWRFTTNEVPMQSGKLVEYQQIGRMVFDDTMLRAYPDEIMFSDAHVSHEYDSYGRNLIKFSFHATGFRGSSDVPLLVNSTFKGTGSTGFYAGIAFPGFTVEPVPVYESYPLTGTGLPDLTRLYSRNVQYIYKVGNQFGTPSSWHMRSFYNDTFDTSFPQDYFVLGCSALSSDGRRLHYGASFDGTGWTGQIVRECTLSDIITDGYINLDYLKLTDTSKTLIEHFQHLRTQYFDGGRAVDEKFAYSLLLSQRADSKLPQYVIMVNDPATPSTIYKSTVIDAGVANTYKEGWLPLTFQQAWYHIFARSGTTSQLPSKIAKLIASYESTAEAG